MGTFAPTLKDVEAWCRRAAAVAFCFSMFINVLMLTAPLYMIQVFDRVLASRSVDTLIYLTIIAAAAFATLAVLEFLRNQVMVRAGVWFDRVMGPDVLGASIARALRGTDAAGQHGMQDLSVIRNFLSGPTLHPLLDAPWTPLFLAVMFLLHPMLGWLAVAGTVLLFMLAVINERVMRKPLKQAGDHFSDSRTWADASIRNAGVIDAMGMMGAAIRKWAGCNDQGLDLQASASVRSAAVKSTAKFIRLFLQVAVLGLGAWLVLGDELTAGGMIAGSILLGRALAPVDQSIASWRSVIMARAAYRRLKATASKSSPLLASMPLPAPKGTVSVQSVSYWHAGPEWPVLRNVSFELAPGECLGIVGPTAAGKTTLGRLLVGSLKPAAGNVRLDGMDVSEWSPSDRGPHVGYLPQTVELFAGPVWENIARLEDGDPEEVVRAAEAAGVHELVLHLPKGYETEIGDGGQWLAAGQRQRIGLARALFGRPRLVVLDEPNSNLDYDGENALLNTLIRLREQAVTTIVIAHRPNILRMADKILVLRNGVVDMLGPRDEVFARRLRPAAHSKESSTAGAAR